MKFTSAIDAFCSDMKAEGRFSDTGRSEVSYRATLMRHVEDVQNRDPRYTNRDDVKRTLTRWTHPNTQRTCRSHLVSFYRWTMEEGLRRDNPAEQTRRPRKREPNIYRLTRDEAARYLAAAKTKRERRFAFLGMCAGLRNQEFRGLQGRHFDRAGFVWISKDIGKGGRERYVPVIPELEPVVEEIREHVSPDEFVLPAQRWRDPGVNRAKVDLSRQPCSPQAIYYLAKRLGKRAGIPAEVHPHLLRHAFGDHIARSTGNVRVAQFMLGHATLGTTETYLDKPSLEEMAAAVDGFGFAARSEHTFQGAATSPAIPLKATTGIEPVDAAGRSLEPFLRHLFASEGLREAARRI